MGETKTSIAENGESVTITIASKDHREGFVAFKVSKKALIDMLSKATEGASVIYSPPQLSS